LLIPLMVWMVQMYQGLGAAWVWIILNLGYLIIEVPIMHRRLLKGEMGKWYGRDIILPIVIVTIIGLVGRVILPADSSKLITLLGVLGRVILPVDSSKLITLLGVLGIFALSFVASAWVAGYLNIKTLKLNRP